MEENNFFGTSNRKYERIARQLQGQPFTKDAEKNLTRYKDMLDNIISDFNTKYITTEKELNNIRNSVEYGVKPYKPFDKMQYEGKVYSLNNLIKDTQSLANELKHTDNVNLNQVAGIINKYGEKITGPQRARLEHILKSLGKANKYLFTAPLDPYFIIPDMLKLQGIDPRLYIGSKKEKQKALEDYGFTNRIW